MLRTTVTMTPGCEQKGRLRMRRQRQQCNQSGVPSKEPAQMPSINARRAVRRRRSRLVVVVLGRNVGTSLSASGGWRTASRLSSPLSLDESGPNLESLDGWLS